MINWKKLNSFVLPIVFGISVATVISFAEIYFYYALEGESEAFAGATVLILKVPKLFWIFLGILLGVWKQFFETQSSSKQNICWWTIIILCSLSVILGIWLPLWSLHSYEFTYYLSKLLN